MYTMVATIVKNIISCYITNTKEDRFIRGYIVIDIIAGLARLVFVRFSTVKGNSYTNPMINDYFNYLLSIQCVVPFPRTCWLVLHRMVQLLPK